MIDTQLQNEIVARLSAKKPLKVILFGSQAYGEFDEGSDVDLLIVQTPGPSSCKHLRSKL